MNLRTTLKQMSQSPEVVKKGLVVFKDYRGKYRWVTLSSNAYRDRDGEIVSMKALGDDVDRADVDKSYGPLRWWHVPGADFGDCDFNAMFGKILVESGTFRNEAVGARMKEIAPELQVSIGFYHPASQPDADGVFYKIRRFERSLLPVGRASNLFTQFAVKGVEDMATNKEKLAELKQKLGDDTLADEIIDGAEASEKTADESGAEFKEKTEDEEIPEEKAKKKVFPPKKEEVDEPETDEEEDVDEEEEEDDEVDEEDDEVDEEDEEKEFNSVGNMSHEQFAELVSGALTISLQPVLERMKELETSVETLNTESKEVKIKQVRRFKESRALSVELEALKKRLKELEGEVPAALSEGYRASQSDDTVIPDTDPRTKEAPHADPIGDFTKFLTTGAAVQS
jgi:hypothetical protein